MRVFLILACLALPLLVLPAPAFAVDASEMFEDPAEEARARDIGRQLRCLVCRNQSIFDSNAGLAKDLREVVRERMIAGDSDDEVLTYIHERFGDYVLLKPPLSAHTAVLWATPLGLVLFGLIGARLYLRRKPEALEDDFNDDDRRAAQALLNRETP